MTGPNCAPLLLFVALAVWTMGGCTAAESSATGDGPVVEADLYSGRPNPTWNLDGPGADAVAACLRTAATTSARVAPPTDGLGFRGLVVRGITVEGDANGSVRALPGVTTLTAGGESFTVPTCASLYLALRESAHGHLTADELDLLPGRPRGSRFRGTPDMFVGESSGSREPEGGAQPAKVVVKCERNRRMVEKLLNHQ